MFIIKKKEKFFLLLLAYSVKSNFPVTIITIKSIRFKNQPQPIATNNTKTTICTGCLVLNITDNLTNNSTIHPTKWFRNSHKSTRANNIVKMIYGYISRNRNKL